MTCTSPDIFSLFSEAVSLESQTEQSEFLEQACGGDSQLRARIAALLEAHAAAGGFFGGPSAALASTLLQSGAETLNCVIGRYKLREVLGTGGMGIVYAAEQEQPIRRHVALKVIKPGMDTREVLARFNAERQALALMDHPGIARVYDAGTTDSGHPYFVMELVRGLPITEYCDHYRLPVEDRLRLFIQVCQAVHHAHQKGIIHRDLKPTNVLISQQDGAAAPKVIDFGVAKATTSRLTDHSLFTRQTELLGTPLYMSPEQAELSGVELDARSDVYALGVLLYELLSGRTPFDRERLSSVSFDEMRRIIREDDPPRPSLRLSTLAGEERSQIATGRNLDERRLQRCLQGNLDWIVMQALAKDRARRYESAAALAKDVQRYLDHQPVSAGPPSVAHRSRRFAQRHAGLVLAAAIIAVGVPLLSAALFNSDRTDKSSAVSGTDRSPRQAESDSRGSATVAQADVASSDPAETNATPPSANAAVQLAPAEEKPAPTEQKSAQADAPAAPRANAATATQQPLRVPPLAVFPFEERGAGAKEYGKKISDFVLANLTAEPDLIVVERAELNKVLDEQKLSAAGLVKQDEAVEVGRLTGAKLIVLGSVVELDSTLLLSARIVSTETSRQVGAKIKGKTSDDLADLAERLSQEVLKVLAARTDEVVSKPVTRVDRLAAIKAALGDKALPKVWVRVAEQHIGQPVIDPAAETELAKLLEDTGFTVIDHKEGNRKQADVVIDGEAFSEFATRHNDLISVKARVEIKAVNQKTGERIATDRQTEIAVDVAEHIAAKTALQTAAAEIASRMLPKLVKAEQ